MSKPKNSMTFREFQDQLQENIASTAPVIGDQQTHITDHQWSMIEDMKPGLTGMEKTPEEEELAALNKPQVTDSIVDEKVRAHWADKLRAFSVVWGKSCDVQLYRLKDIGAHIVELDIVGAIPSSALNGIARDADLYFDRHWTWKHEKFAVNNAWPLSPAIREKKIAWEKDKEPLTPWADANVLLDGEEVFVDLSSTDDLLKASVRDGNDKVLLRASSEEMEQASCKLYVQCVSTAEREKYNMICWYDKNGNMLYSYELMEMNVVEDVREDYIGRKIKCSKLKTK